MLFGKNAAFVGAAVQNTKTIKKLCLRCEKRKSDALGTGLESQYNDSSFTLWRGYLIELLLAKESKGVV